MAALPHEMFLEIISYMSGKYIFTWQQVNSDIRRFLCRSGRVVFTGDYVPWNSVWYYCKELSWFFLENKIEYKGKRIEKSCIMHNLANIDHYHDSLEMDIYVNETNGLTCIIPCGTHWHNGIRISKPIIIQQAIVCSDNMLKLDNGMIIEFDNIFLGVFNEEFNDSKIVFLSDKYVVLVKYSRKYTFKISEFDDDGRIQKK